tara:strand:- start:1138 stop:2505 length:1368 start_codon:yes stop_codon:yes gene_type:complete
MENRKTVSKRRQGSTHDAATYVKSFTVEKLFGELSYRNISLAHSANQLSPIAVIHGDNGTGKTTILKLLYAVLSPTTNRGHRTLIAETPFESLCIEFSDDTKINIEKKELYGSYSYVFSGTGTSKRLHVKTSSDGRVKSQESIEQIENRLKEKNLDILFVDHERTVQSTFSFISDIFDDETTSERWALYHQDLLELDTPQRRLLRKSQRLDDEPLPKIVDAVEYWFRTMSFQQGNMGEQNASAVYLEIINALVSQTSNKLDDNKAKIDIRMTLQNLEETTKSYINHGLLSEYPFDKMHSIYDKANPNQKKQVKKVLLPFIQSIQSRVSALKEVNDLISIYETELGRYMSLKKCTYHILKGLEIRGKKGRITLPMLSSGEQQLVFLLSAALLSRSSRSLILIDEPELSLNYKWQRLLASSLSQLSSGTNTQYVLASHSIEIISRHVDSAYELKVEN